MITVGELRRGVTMELDSQLYSVVDFEHIKMGRGGALARLKLRNLRTGSNIERTFPASEKFRRVYLERRKVQYQYRDGDLFNFMDTESFEQLVLNERQVGDAINYIKENDVVDVLMFDDEPIDLEMPVTVDLRVEQTDPGFKGDTATGGTKPATVETGARINVPLFVTIGDVIRVDTRTGNYVERVN